MQRYTNNIQTQTGQAIAGATVTVLNFPSLTPATIYLDNNSTPLANPVTTDSNGFFAFYAVNGRYSIRVSGANILPYQVDDILAEDQLSLPTITGASLVGFQQPLTGSVPTTVQAKLADYVSVKADFGAKGDGVTNDDAARAAAESASSNVYWPPGNYVLSQAPSLTKSWGPGICTVGGSIVYLRPTATPAKSIAAAIFGLPATNTTDASAALQAAINFAQSVRLPVEFPTNGDFRLATGLTIQHGQNSTDTFSYLPQIIGNNTKLRPNPGITALSIVPRCLLADKATSRGNAHMDIQDLLFDGLYANASSSAISCGAAGKWMDDFQFSFISDILINGFPLAATVANFTEHRHVKFTRFVVRSGGVHFQASTAGSFLGDMQFDMCEFTGTKTFPPLALLSSGGASGNVAQVRGLRFNDLTVYGSGTIMQATGFSQLGDIWFNNPQWDGPSANVGESAVEILASGSTAAAFDINFNTPYIVNYQGCGIYAHGVSSGIVTAITVNSPYANSMTLTSAGNADQNSVIAFQNVAGGLINGGELTQITGDGSSSSVINCDTVTNVSVHAVSSYNNTAVIHGVTIGGTGTNNYKVTDNMMNVSDAAAVNDYTSGTPTRLVANNLKI